ncbi:hypothetical protein IV203_019086 [Nitzschia inconspicua]|uniref:Uncharacterized protein n=1 Tax=Nitzschia inconspicua TaxID=303405 RepID=A0A9K3M1F5_9STRA|nr:hypothetical protein IV203_019086 [Nitzschia inconspicua]
MAPEDQGSAPQLKAMAFGMTWAVFVASAMMMSSFQVHGYSEDSGISSSSPKSRSIEGNGGRLGSSRVLTLTSASYDAHLSLTKDDPSKSTSIQRRSLDEIRFNKCPPADPSFHTESKDYVPGVHKGIYPLLPVDYPLPAAKAAVLKTQTLGDSVIVPGDHQLFGALPDEWLSRVKPPTYPQADPNAPFWRELRSVIRSQKKRRSSDPPSDLSRWPDTWSSFDLEDIAAAVDAEYPASLQQSLIMQTFADGGFQMDKSIVEFRSVRDFIGNQVRIAALNTWAFDVVAPISFMLKWHTGVPRPEEMAWLIGSGQYGIDDGVPQDIVDDLVAMNLTKAEDFTAYKQGSPTHPSWPAMHSSGSSCSFWLPAVAKMTPEQYCEALRVDFAVAFARTVAGVHYPMDNYAGLNLGSKIMIEKLPGHLAEYYGYNETAVRSRLEALEFDWETFDPRTCTIGGVPVGDRLLQ